MNIIKLYRAVGLLLIFLLQYIPNVTATTNQLRDNKLRLYVAPNGDDKSPGTIDQPLASLIGARDWIRKHKKNNPNSGSVTVLIRGGEWNYIPKMEAQQKHL